MAYENEVYINGNAKVEGNIYGGVSNINSAYENEVYINDNAKVEGNIYGGYSDSSNAEYNIVTISGGIIGEANDIVNIYGGWSTSGKADNNEIIISGSADIENANLYGCNDNATGTNNTLIIDGWDGNNIEGNEWTVNSLNNFDVLEFKNIKGDIGLTAKSVNGMDKATIIISSIDGTNSKITLSDNIGELISQDSIDIDTTALDGWNFKDNESNGIYADYVDADAKYENNTIEITGSVTKSVLTGKFIDESGKEHYKGSSTPDDTTDDATTLTIDNNFKTNAATIAGVYAAGSKNAENGVIYISGDNITYGGTVYAGYSESGSASGNTINVAAGTNASEMTLSGTNNTGNTGNDNVLNLEGSAAFNAINNFDAINFNNLNISKDTVLTVNSTDATDKTAIKINSVASGTLNFTAGDYEEDTTTTLSSVSWSPALGNKVTTVTIAKDLFKNVQLDDYYFTDNGSSGIYVNQVSLNADDSNKTDNKVDFNIKVDKSILTGKFIDESGAVYYNSNQTENTASLTIGNGFNTKVGIVAGTYAANKTDGTAQNAKGGVVNISDSTDWNGTVYAGYSEKGSASDNTINVLSATNASKMTLSGGNTGSTGNTLNITGNGSTFNSIEDFDTINFKDVVLNSTDVLTLNSADLTGTALNVENLADGKTFKAGDTVTLIAGNIEGTPTLTHDKVTAGLSQDLSVEEIINNSSVQLSVKDVSLNDQITLVAENRAVAAAFVNQGTDLIADSLDTISRDSNYGVKTFAAVHGNRSKYDVNSDIKINGWSTIVGVGNADKFDNGSKFSWGVFYENGSGNYRTYNEFNNEFFRGDGSLVYNGGGIAARYTNKNGVYTEGSLRAGMLKSDMDNALRDGAGNFYGYESESAYYGAHIGIGKIISLSESSDLDVYGKFFHTYTEGDSFKVANDEFEFDSINSDRLRIGARITSNKENKFSTYYGLAYEYEFNGDADMTAQGLKAPTQSLQGSSIMAEIGFNYQPTPTSPWSFDLNMRGYAGERQGGSFNVQATYTF